MNERSTGGLYPDWHGIPDNELTAQQRLAKRTHGIVRLPNLMTALGVGATVAAVSYAEDGKYGLSAAAAVFAAGMDADGSVARHYHVSDPRVGGPTDQIADVVKETIIGGSLIKNDVLPGDAAILTYAPKAVGAAAGVVAKLKTGVDLPSSQVGKAAEVARMIVPIGFIVGAAGEKHHKPWLEKTGDAIGWTATTAACVLGSIAAAGYVRAAIAAKK